MYLTEGHLLVALAVVVVMTTLAKVGSDIIVRKILS